MPLESIRESSFIDVTAESLQMYDYYTSFGMTWGISNVEMKQKRKSPPIYRRDANENYREQVKATVKNCIKDMTRLVDVRVLNYFIINTKDSFLRYIAEKNDRSIYTE